MFTLRVKRRQLKIIEKLPAANRTQIKDALKVLKIDPVPVKVFDVRKLEGYKRVYKIIVGGYRLVYSVDWDEKVITVHFVGSRKKAYK